MTIETICQFEHIVNKHFSTCEKPRMFAGDNLRENLPCKYQRVYPTGKYCRKRKELENAREYDRFQDKQGEHTGVGL